MKKFAMVVGVVFVLSGGFVGVAVGDITTNLVGHWAFDEGNGTTAGDSAGSYDGTLINDPNWITGVSGSALEFYGSEEYVSIPAIPDCCACEGLTVSGWVRRSCSRQRNLMPGDNRQLSRSI